MGHRALPHRGARRPCRALRGLRAHSDRLQQLPQPALSKVPGRSRKAWLAEREAELLPVPLLPRRLHAAGADRRHRLSEQGRDLRPLVQGLVRDHAHHRGRSQASRRPHRHHVGAAHLGLGHDPPSARPHDRAGRRHLHSMAHAGVAAGPRFFLPRARSLAPVPPPDAGKSSWPPTRPAGCSSSAPTRISPSQRPSPPILAPLRKISGYVYAKRPFGGPQGRARLSVALHPPRRHLQQPADRVQRHRRHVQMQGLPHRRAAPATRP